MITNIILSLIFLFLFGLVIIHGRHAKSGIGEKPIIYQSIVVQFFLNISLLVFLGFSIFLIFFSWKLLLILLIAGFIIEGWIIVPIIEKMIYWSVNRIVAKAEKQNNVKNVRLE